MVIGYGNALRGDDGVGPAVIELLRSRRPEVNAIAVPMLLPELAPMLADAEVVVFVDARVGGEAGAVRVDRIACDAIAGPFGHLLSAQTLLALAAKLYGCRARAFHISVAGRDYEIGAPMSDEVAAAVPRAADAVLATIAAAESAH